MTAYTDEQRLEILLMESASFAFDHERELRFMVCPGESRDLDVIWMVKALDTRVSTPIARIRMDLPAYAEKNSSFVNPEWILSDEEIEYFNRFIRQTTEPRYNVGPATVTVFQNAILALNDEKYSIDPDKTLMLRYSAYQDRREGPLPFDLPIPDYLQLKSFTSFS